MKATWINVNGYWKKVKNVWININGNWKQKIIPQGNILGNWKEFIEYYRKAKYLFIACGGKLKTIDIATKTCVDSIDFNIKSDNLKGLSVNPMQKTIYVFGSGIYKYKFDDKGKITLLCKLTNVYCTKLQVDKNDNVFAVINEKLYRYNYDLTEKNIIYVPEYNDEKFDFTLDEKSNTYIINTNGYDNLQKIKKDGEIVFKKFVNLPTAHALVINYFPSSKKIYITAGFMTGDGYNITVIDSVGNKIGNPDGAILSANRKMHNLENYLYLFPHRNEYQKRDLDGNIIFNKYLTLPNYIDADAINNDGNFFIVDYYGGLGMTLYFFNKNGEREDTFRITDEKHNTYIETEFGNTGVFNDFYKRILN